MHLATTIDINVMATLSKAHRVTKVPQRMG